MRARRETKKTALSLENIGKRDHHFITTFLFLPRGGCHTTTTEEEEEEEEEGKVFCFLR